MNPAWTPPLRRQATVAVAVALAFAAGAAGACELDGLSHGYGPVSSLFAGMHRGPALDGREDKPPPEMPAIEIREPATNAAALEALAATASPPADASPPPRRSFTPWIRAKPKAGEPPAPTPPAAPPPVAGQAMRRGG